MDYQIPQLDSYFEENLFGIEFDYNSFVSQELADKALSLKTDLISNTEFNDSTDIDPEKDNIIALIGHQDENLNTALFAIRQVKRTQDILVLDDPITWQSPLPFIKILHQILLPSGENIISGFDILGIALKINDSSFNPTHYLLGYANLPVNLLNLLRGLDIENIFETNVESELPGDFPIFNMMIEIEESFNSLNVNIIYSNCTFIFQTEKIDFFELNLAENIIIAQFDEVKFSINIRKYNQYDSVGIETITDISIGNIVNLIINEELPTGTSWSNAFNYTVEEDFSSVFNINETFSLYQGFDIVKRLRLFSNIAFSVITAQNLGIVNGTENLDDITIYVDEKNQTREELAINDYQVKNKVTCFFNNELLLLSQVQGRDFAIQNYNTQENISLTPIRSQTLALNQHYGFSHNYLFLQETSLMRDLVVYCVKQFANNPLLSSLSANNLYKNAGLYFTSAQYIQEFQVIDWTSSPISLSLLQFTKQISSLSSKGSNKGHITYYYAIPGVLAIILLSGILKKRRRVNLSLKKS
ncbi:MAG: hypothetical protein ACFFAU_04015 [Candidatus Hodarchaeota archaeon]